MNDPLYRAYSSASIKPLLSRFRSLAGYRKLSDWQVFCNLLAGVTCYWFVSSRAFSVNVHIRPSRQFSFTHDYLLASVSVDGLVNDETISAPEFCLPYHSSPYEYCRWHNKRGFRSPSTWVAENGLNLNKGMLMPEADNSRVLVWEGNISVFDKSRFRDVQLAGTVESLEAEIRGEITAGLERHFRPYWEVYDSLFPSPSERWQRRTAIRKTGRVPVFEDGASDSA